MQFEFYKGKRVLVTGHTGFKGTWLCKALLHSGADVYGYALDPNTQPNLFDLSGLNSQMNSVIGDIRNLDLLKQTLQKVQPEIVFHLAAQPIVLEGYENPAYTFETNMMGTVNILESIRETPSVKSFLNVTTDKVYQNDGRQSSYKESDYLEGFDPYSNSKSCSELITHCYNNSFLSKRNVAVSTARAGNVIGGGDFAINRIIPDCIKSALKNETIIVRNPNSIRPYQHVLEPIFVYMMIAQKQYQDIEFSGSYNVGPDDCDCITTGQLVDLFCKNWGNGLAWESKFMDGPHEANYLKLDCSKLKHTFNWSAKWGIDLAVNKTVEWVNAYLEGNMDILDLCMKKQINDYLAS